MAQRIVHYGLLTVNRNARIGDAYRVQEGVNIGAKNNGESPTIGDHVYCILVAVTIGDVHIASNVVISAAVVRSIEEENTMWAGGPEKKISEYM